MDSNNPMFNMGTDNAATDSTGKVDIYIRDDAGAATVNHAKSNGGPFDGTWRHLALTDNNGAVRYYIDGVPDTATLAYTRPTMTLNTLSIGGIKRLGGELALFNGAVDEVAVWNRVLSQEEIQSVMTNGLATPVPPLIQVDRPGPWLQGDRVRLTVEVKAEEPASWQWRRNGVDIPGATESAYVVSALTEGAQGDYSVLLNGAAVSSVVSLSFAADPAPNVAGSLVSSWPFNALTTDTQPPSSPDPWGGHPLSCLDISEANLVPGKFGDAMDFDGFSGIAVRTTGFPIASNPEYSVSLWVKGDGSGQSDKRVFAEGSNLSNSPLFALGTANDGSNRMRVYLRSDTGTELVARHTETEVFDDSWHHVVWTDRNGQARLYVDGVLDGTGFNHSRAGQTLTLNQTSIGAIQRAVSDYFCRAAVDDVAVWNRALTWSEVQSLMTAGVPAPVTVTAPDITVQPLSRTLWAGRAVMLSVQATGTGPFTYTWLKDGNPVAGAAEPTLTIDPAAPTDSGAYVCQVTNSAGTDTSDPAVLTVRAISGLETGLLSLWPLDSAVTAEETSTTPDTVSGRSLTLNGFDLETAFQPAVKNNGIFLDGVDDLLVHTRTGVGNDIPLSTREEFTVSFWVRGDGVDQLDRRVFSESSTASTQPLFNLGTDNAGVTDLLEFYIRGDSAIAVDHTASLAPVFDGAWHHVIYTDHQGQGQLYVDGNPDVALNYTRPVSTLTNISVGGIARATPGHWFAGAVDEISTWERALSETEAAQLYHSQTRPSSLFSITGVTAPASGNRIQLTVATSLGEAAYRVDSTADLGAGPWTEVAGAVLSPVVNGVLTVDIPVTAGGGRRFYRVVVP